MTDPDELSKTIIEDRAARGHPISKLGYFCAPFRPQNGPLLDRVIKVYRSLADDAALDRLAHAHTDYVALLKRTNVGLPETEFHLLDLGGRRTPVVVQQALDARSMMRPQLITADRQTALNLMDSAGKVIAGFWNALEERDGRVGFHPSIRNFAIVDGRAMFFDTFPPLIGYSRDEMGDMLLQFSEKRLMRWIGPVLRQKVTGIQDEWYSPPETLVGLVGSACRLRPDDAEAFLSWGRDFAQSEMPRWSDEVLTGLKVPPRLPGYWTGFRKLLGLQGEPNIQ
jgi:hypothetical protein